MNEENVVTTSAPTDFQKWEAEPETETSEAAAAEAGAPAAESIAEESDTSNNQETDSETENEDEPKPETPKGKKLAKRFHELTGKIRDLESKLAAKTGTPEAKTELAAPAVDKGKPKAEDFDTYEAFMEELTNYQLDQREQKRAAQEIHNKRIDAWESRSAEAKAKHPDFDEIVSRDNDVHISQAMELTILDSELGPDLAYYFGKNHAEALRISKLNPLAAAREIGKIEATLVKPATPETRKPAVTRAPKPPTPVGGSSAADLGKEPDPSDFAKWSKWKDRQERAEED